MMNLKFDIELTLTQIYVCKKHSAKLCKKGNIKKGNSHKKVLRFSNFWPRLARVSSSSL